MTFSYNYEEDNYLDLLYCLKEKLENEEVRNDRTGVGCVSRFADQLRFNISVFFPLLTTKKVHFKSVFYELAWFLKGSTNTKYLNDNGVSIWDEWAVSEEQASKHHPMIVSKGDLGPVYGKMWRNWPQPSLKYIDQISNIIDSIKNKPNSRRHVVSSWNPSYLPDESKSPQENVIAGKQALPPCHCLFQFFVEDGKLSCQLYQRSADIFLGVPFNIASYALLTNIIANICDLKPGEFILTFGDVHLYKNHLKPAEIQLKRESRPFPTLKIKRKLELEDLNDLKIEDFEILGYHPHGSIPATIAI